MSLAVDVDLVSAVLLPDGWYVVDRNGEGSSFGFDAYEVIWWGSQKRMEDCEPVMTWQGTETIGFTFSHDGSEVCGPMSSILAIRMRESRSVDHEPRADGETLFGAPLSHAPDTTGRA